MNTLSFPALLNKIGSSQAITEPLAAFTGGKFPLELDSAEGAFAAILIARLFNANDRGGPFLVVTPTDREAEDLAGDLETLGVPSAVFPWWGAMPYREMAPLSTVFGERTKVLADLLSGRSGVVIAPERAFLTPLPPPEYLRSLLITIKPGAAIDTAALAETLTGYGYTRVPRVQVHGEFALRGEVLDILMGGDESDGRSAAYRVLFDFDTVESIKRFDPVDQSTIGQGGQGRAAELVIRPLKEVVWSDERILVLSRALAAAEEFTQNGQAALEDLMARRFTPGEEMLFPMAFEEGAACLLDYLDGGTVFYLDRERLENAQESLDREYESLYRKGRRNLPANGEGEGGTAGRGAVASGGNAVGRAASGTGGGASGRVASGADGGNAVGRAASGIGGGASGRGASGADGGNAVGRAAAQAAFGSAMGAHPSRPAVRPGAAPPASTRELPAPSRILLQFGSLVSRTPRRVSFMTIKGGGEEAALRIALSCDPPRSFFGNITYLKEEFAALAKQGWQLLVAAESDVQAARIRELFREELPGEDAPSATADTAGTGRPPAVPAVHNEAKAAALDTPISRGSPSGHVPASGRAPAKAAAVGTTSITRSSPTDRASGSAALPLTVADLPLSAGFSLPDIKLMVVQENEIFGRRKRLPRSLKKVRSAAIDTFVELNPGDYIVHVNYGIGLFKGIERIRALGHERDYVKLEYLGEETVFVPIEQVNMVQRYIGNEGSPPRLDKLGSKSWENRKGRVKKSVEDIAQRLIELYSKRKAAQGYAYPRDTEWQTMFEAAFPFEETEDQLRCVEEIKDDMESPHPMDRLVCGDVGYGKTEVAVRACFKAVMGGKQVAFLAPTTILAEQHFENFQERFAQFPVRLGMLSRFVDRGVITKTLEAVKKGDIDILVGTHRLIQKDVLFKNLGLMVIDEEQRFGVKDKERLKEMKTNVDCLTLSATPIPRTLHMSLLKIRDMSLLATPPNNRHPIETVIEEFNEERLAAAIRAEVERGGQIFFLHNRVESLNQTRIMIEHLVPEMLVDTAHGQMDAHELEDVMHRFIHGGFHVLVSTTIIENGIDIPNVNTIIIDRADMYGVSQLYQLRGRVGRSDRVAYAYLFYPKDKALTELAMKRLQVISDFTELGSGFKIAMKDMEIRGAGNLLGREQSGDIYSVGFELYLRLLEEAVRRLEDSSFEAENETLLELEYTGFIPNEYIDGAQEKMEVYKKIAAVKDRDELESLHAELLDRFGPLPDEAASLLSLAEIRIICREIAVSSLKERGGLVRVEFGKVSKVKIDALIRLMQESSGKVKLDPRAANVLTLQTGNIGLKEKSEFIREKLAALAG
ncbi:hypothetical protein FACS1894130_05730 [Spirochaetia bacterium]|nr:hypothetical protein FACS1894130_05730 [Spirochaetia bacterium]